MDKINQENLKKVINYKKLSEDSVFTVFLLNLLAVLIIVLLGKNHIKSFLILIPFIIAAAVILSGFKLLKKKERKFFNLFCGLECVVLSLICQCGCFLVAEFTKSDGLKFLLLMLLIHTVIIALLLGYFITLVRKKKIIAYKPVSVSIIVASSLFGARLARHLDLNATTAFLFVFAGFSAIVTVFAVCYIVIYHYSNLLEKIENE